MTEIEIESKACQSKSDTEIFVFMLSNISHYQENEIEISSSPVNRDASDVVRQAVASFDPRLWTFPMTDALCHDTVQSGPTQQLRMLY
ncbi:hypothetical protein TNCV_1914571 [Trichonephila clavipes]|nr:hypothetical protein TNCV_1914571 [Trichonephila clavipes]